MSAREFAARARKAEAEGEKAYRDGVAKNECPYRESNWGVGPFWKMGWDNAARAASVQREEQNNG